MIARPHSILLDAEGVTAYADDDKRIQTWSIVAKRTNSRFHASAATLAEVTDGTARDANVRRVSKHIEIHEVTEEIGYKAGALRAVATAIRKKPRDLTVDALVAATAMALPRPVVVLTSDVADLELLLSDEPGIRVRPL